MKEVKDKKGKIAELVLVVLIDIAIFYYLFSLV